VAKLGPVDYQSLSAALSNDCVAPRQRNQTLRLMQDVARSHTGSGSIVALRPTATDAATDTPATTDQACAVGGNTSTLVRAGIDEPYSFTNSSLLTSEFNAGFETVRDLILGFDTRTLGYGRPNATVVRIGQPQAAQERPTAAPETTSPWTMRVWQDRDNPSRAGPPTVHYEIGGYKGGASQQRAATTLRVNFAADTINGESIPEGEQLRARTPAPGQDNYFWVTDYSSFGTTAPKGLINARFDGLPTTAVTDAANTDTVIDEISFDVSYIDTGTTYTDRVTITPTYTDVANTTTSDRRSPWGVADLTIETETIGNHTDVQSPLRTYNVSVTAAHANGTTVDVTDETSFEVLDTDTLANCTDCYDFAPTRGTANPHQPSEYFIIATWTDPTGTDHTPFEAIEVINPVERVTAAVPTTTLGTQRGVYLNESAPISAAITFANQTTITRSVASTPTLTATRTGGHPVDAGALAAGTLAPAYTPGGEGTVALDIAHDQFNFTTPNASTTVDVFDPIQDLQVSMATGTPLNDSRVLVNGSRTYPLTVEGVLAGGAGTTTLSNASSYAVVAPSASAGTVLTGGGPPRVAPQQVTAVGQNLTVEASHTVGGITDPTKAHTARTGAPASGLALTNVTATIAAAELNVSETTTATLTGTVEPVTPGRTGAVTDPLVNVTNASVETLTRTNDVVALGETLFANGTRRVTGLTHGTGILNVSVDPAASSLVATPQTASDTVEVGLHEYAGVSGPYVLGVPGVPRRLAPQTVGPASAPARIDLALKDSAFRTFPGDDVALQTYAVYPYNGTAFASQEQFFEAMNRTVTNATGLPSFGQVRANASQNVSRQAWHSGDRYDLEALIAGAHRIRTPGGSGTAAFDKDIPADHHVTAGAGTTGQDLMDAYVVRLTGEGAPTDVSDTLVPSTNASVPTASVGANLSTGRVTLTDVTFDTSRPLRDPDTSFDQVGAYVTVTNPTTQSVTRRLELRTNGTRIREAGDDIDTSTVRTVTLAPGETRQVELYGRTVGSGSPIDGPTVLSVDAWVTNMDIGALGTRGYVRLDDRTTTMAASGPAPGRLVVQNLTTSKAIGTVTATATVTNVGGQALTTDVPVLINGSVSATRTVTLAPGATETITATAAGTGPGLTRVRVAPNGVGAATFARPAEGTLVSDAPLTVGQAPVRIRPDDGPESVSPTAPNDLVLSVTDGPTLRDAGFGIRMTALGGDPAGLTTGPAVGGLPTGPVDAKVQGVVQISAEQEYNNVNGVAAGGFGEGSELIPSLFNILSIAADSGLDIRDESGSIEVFANSTIDVDVLSNEQAVETFNSGEELTCEFVEDPRCTGGDALRLPYHGVDFFRGSAGPSITPDSDQQWTNAGGTVSVSGDEVTLDASGISVTGDSTTIGQLPVIRVNDGGNAFDGNEWSATVKSEEGGGKPK
jgi:hypothetical protein